MFTDSLNENVDSLAALLSGIPPESRQRAKRAAVAIEKVVDALRKDHPRDPVVGLGVAFAVMLIAQRMVESEKSGEDKPLIQLLS